MKRGLLFSLVFIFILGAFSISHASVDTIYEVAVIDIKGDVKVDIKGSGEWVTPWIGMKLMKNAVIKTGPGSKVDIVFDAEGLNVVEIDENTQVTVDKSLLNLTKGSVLANFPNLTGGSTFTVKTPTAACAIRGSGMGVDFIQGMTIVSAYEDKVYVQGLDANGNKVGKEVIIPEGWKTQVKAGNVQPPAELSDNEKAIFNAFVEAVEKGVGLAPTPDLGKDTELDGKDLDDVKDEGKKEDVSPSS